ncbi:cysteine-rich receptor-like protein kinase [Trifolium pratense]|uniref:Cysteine-rich receptor-like protein kinase n=1 Tax=Trifolium pratense TaxID=57577 RepID=A0A2K3KVU3_TRIPR|nr:cysteine-rich receptor-like protein kinase [Trifolium pratense]
MWWREIASIREGVGVSKGRWFGDHVVRRVGDGVDIFFWTDPLLDEAPLSERFRRLFELAETKSFTVAEMFYRGWGTDGAAWVWHPDTGFTVCGAYQLLTTLDSVTLDEAEHLIWHPQVPLKSRLITYSSPAALLVLFGI